MQGTEGNRGTQCAGDRGEQRYTVCRGRRGTEVHSVQGKERNRGTQCGGEGEEQRYTVCRGRRGTEVQSVQGKERNRGTQCAGEGEEQRYTVCRGWRRMYTGKREATPPYVLLVVWHNFQDKAKLTHLWNLPALSSLSAVSNSLKANSSMCACATTSSLLASSSLRAFFNCGWGKGGEEAGVSLHNYEGLGTRWDTTQEDHTWLIWSIWVIRNALPAASFLLAAIPSCIAYSLPENDKGQQSLCVCVCVCLCVCVVCVHVCVQHAWVQTI